MDKTEIYKVSYSQCFSVGFFQRWSEYLRMVLFEDPDRDCGDDMVCQIRNSIRCYHKNAISKAGSFNFIAPEYPAHG